ncbi:MAG: HAMP domain-containing sensor histidine kinase [Rhodoferax sp.]|nr:HAMP domain-containing sensor histidine kinase [Rhodoferax sp.]
MTRPRIRDTAVGPHPDGLPQEGGALALRNEAQHLLHVAPIAALMWRASGVLEPCNPLALQWWSAASAVEQLELQRWCQSAVGDVTECTLRWSHEQHRVLHVRSLRMPHGERALYLQDITRAHDLDRAKSDFLSAAAHELRTPLASIYGFAELMLLRNLPPEQQKELLGTIHRQAKSLINLINELLDLSRIDARQGKDLNMAPCRLASLVDGAVEGLHIRANTHQITCHLRHGVATVLADREKTRQALLNVLSNAVKYSPRGGRITVSTARREVHGHKQLGIRVRDEGLGMDESQRSRACERFYRANPLGDIPGTGLGLSLVLENMHLQSGALELQSALGRGTTVTLWFSTPHTETADPHGPVSTTMH